VYIIIIIIIVYDSLRLCGVLMSAQSTGPFDKVPVRCLSLDFEVNVKGGTFYSSQLSKMTWL
jgi:hypothetical protein